MGRYFDDTTDTGIDCGDNYDYDWGDAWSVGAIWRCDSMITGDERIIISKFSSSSSYRHFSIEIDNIVEPSKMLVYQYDGYKITGSASLYEDTWYLSALTSDGSGETSSGKKLVTIALDDINGTPIDNVENSTQFLNKNGSSYSLFVGRRVPAGNEMNGTIAHAFTVNAELTLDELRHFARSPQQAWTHWLGKGYVGSTSFYMPLYGDLNPEPDLSGNGLTGTPTGSAAKGDNPPVLYPSAQILQFPSAGAATAVVTGTMTTDSPTESDIVTGGKTVIITLTGDTFVTGTSSEDGIAGGGDSDKSGANKWDALIKVDLDNTDVVLSGGNTVATITLPAYGTYDTDETEVITWTIPAASLTGGVEIVATPTFSITSVLAGRIMSSLTRHGGLAGYGGIAGKGGGLAG